MTSLTYSDRNKILELVKQLKKQKSSTSDHDLISSVSAFFNSYRRTHGYEYGMLRDSLALSYHLIDSDLESVRDTARAGLLYLLLQEDAVSDTIPDLGLQDDCYVLSLALREIAGLTESPILHSGPLLSEERRDWILRSLEIYRDRPRATDDELIAEANRVRSVLGIAESHGPYRRFARQLRLLSSALSSTDCPEGTSWARAGLSYLLAEDDSIPDHLGLVGYYDDAYAVQIASRMLDGNEDSLCMSLDNAVSSWPFLSWLVLTDGDYRHSVSEFMILNSAIAKRQMSAESNALALYSPSIGPSAFLLGFLAAVGNVCDAVGSGLAQASFERGDKVLLSNNAVRVFDGISTIDGKNYIRLAETKVRRGQRLDHAMLLEDTPVNRARLRPAAPDRKARGKVAFDLPSDMPISAIDRLLHGDHPVQLVDLEKSVVVVTSQARSRQLAETIYVLGQKLGDVVPMAFLASDGDVGRKPGPWGTTPPVLVVTPWLEAAIEWSESVGQTSAPLIIIDGSRDLSSHSSSLRHLHGKHHRTLILADHSSNDSTRVLSELGFDTSGWRKDDLKHLSWSAHTRQQKSTIASYERTLLRHAKAIVRPLLIPSPPAASCLDALRRLSDHVRNSHSSDSPQLQQQVATARIALNALLSSVAPHNAHQATSAFVSEKLAIIEDYCQSNLFLDADTVDLLTEVLEAQRHFLVEVEQANRKAQALSEQLTCVPPSVVAFKDLAPYQDLQQHLSSPGAQTARAIRLDEVDQLSELEQLFLPRWLRRDTMSRLLYPPVVMSITLLLYECEAEAYHGLVRSISRSSMKSPADLLSPSTSHTTSKLPPSSRKNETDLPDIEVLARTVQTFKREAAIRSATSTASEPVVAAWIAWFSDGSHAFLTDGFHAKRVNHLLRWSGEGPQERPEIELTARASLQPGDRLLFNVGADSDAILVEADRILGDPEVRRTSLMWKAAILNYLRDPAHLPTDLLEAIILSGCKRQEATIMRWIECDDILAPRDLEDLRHIAAATQDSDLSVRLEDCTRAVHLVRGAHVRASHNLARRVVAAFIDRQDEDRAVVSNRIALEDNLVIVRLDLLEIDDNEVRRSLANRLID